MGYKWGEDKPPKETPKPKPKKPVKPKRPAGYKWGALKRIK